MIKTYEGDASQRKQKIKELDNYFLLEAPTLNELSNELFSRSLFDAQKIVIVEGLNNLPDTKATINCFKNKRKDILLIVSCDNFSKHPQLKKYLKANSGFSTLKKLSDKEARSYTIKKASLLSLKFKKDALDYFLFLTGNLTENIDTELKNFDKKDIDINDVVAYVTRRTDINIFNVLDAIMERDKKATISAYLDSSPSNLGTLINMLIWKVEVAIQLKEKNKKFSCNPYVEKVTNKQIKAYPLESLINLYVELCEINQDYQGNKAKLFLALNKFWETKINN